MSDYEYRLLIIRYLLESSVGCYLAIGKTIPNKSTAMITVSDTVVGHIEKGVKKIGDRLFVLLGKLVKNR